MTRSSIVALVGNAPVGDVHRDAIDGCDRVVRFNDARGFGTHTGSRIDDLFLVNRGGAPAQWLKDPAFAARPAVAAARTVVLPLHPDSAFLDTRRDDRGHVHLDDTDHTAALTARLGTSGRSVIVLGHEDHERCCRRLELVPVPRTAVPALPGPGLDRGSGDPASPAAAVQRPSTGFVALSWYLDTLPPGATLRLYGFTFEGWPGHPWERERAWVGDAARAGRVEIVPVRERTVTA